MSDIFIESFRETHQSFNWIEHEAAIIFNVVHFALSIYYILYECLSWLFMKLGYPHLPSVTYLKDGSNRFNLQLWITPASKVVALLGAGLGFFGSSNWNLSLVLAGSLLYIPFASYDVYLMVKQNFHYIDVDDFLLFQTLFSSTHRFVGICATTANLMLIIHFAFRLPPEFKFSDFL